MKKILFILIGFLLISPLVFSAPTDDQTNAAIEKARQDYKIYLEKLKEMSHQYKGVTTQIKNVVKEEGIPVWNEDTGEIDISKNVQLSPPQSLMKDVDIQETENDILVKADFPGLKKESIKASLMDQKVLHVSGVQDSAAQSGPFERTIELPSPAKDSGVEAKYENGVLVVKIPKAREVKKEVTVKVN